MNGCCGEVIEPSIKLGRMVTLLKLVIMAHFFLIIIDIFLIDTGFFFFLFVQAIILFMGISSKHFGHYQFFILICVFNIYISIEALGIGFQNGFTKKDDTLNFCLFVFIIVFEIFCVFVVFQAYKQSKQEYRIKYGYAEGENGEGGIIENAQDIHDNIQGINDLQINNINNNNNNNRGFVPFQGRGVAVGGN